MGCCSKKSDPYSIPDVQHQNPRATKDRMRFRRAFLSLMTTGTCTVACLLHLLVLASFVTDAVGYSFSLAPYLFLDPDTLLAGAASVMMPVVLLGHCLIGFIITLQGRHTLLHLWSVLCLLLCVAHIGFIIWLFLPNNAFLPLSGGNAQAMLGYHTLHLLFMAFASVVSRKLYPLFDPLEIMFAETTYGTRY